MSKESEQLRRHCAEMSNFKDIVRRSKTLTFQQKSTLIGQAKAGDLAGAWKGYKNLVGSRKEEA